MKKIYMSGLTLLVGLLLTGVAMAQGAFRYYYSDITNNGSNIYEVELVGNEAHMTWLASVPYGAHIAFKDAQDSLYIENEGTGNYQTLSVTDPGSGLSAVHVVGNAQSGLTTAAFSQVGKLYMGSMNTHDIYTLNNTNSLQVYNTGNDISGGDMTFLNSNLYLAAKPNGKFYQVNDPGPNTMLGYVDNQVTGIAASDAGTILESAVGNTAFKEYGFDNNGHITFLMSYAAKLVTTDGLQDFTLHNGDMASGYKGPQFEVSQCPNFKTYYASHVPGGNSSQIFEANMVNNGVILTHLFDVNYRTHIGLNTTTGELYLVHEDGSAVDVYNPDGSLQGTLNIQPALNSLVAVAYNPTDNKLYVGSDNQNKVYTIDVATGASSLFASNIPVFGGDLVVNDAGDLYLFSREGQSTLYQIVGGAATNPVSVAPEVNGAALTADGGFITANFGGTDFYKYDANGQNQQAWPVFYNDQPFNVSNGDMASGCVSQGSDIGGGGCYAESVVAYAQGRRSNGQPIPAIRSDISKVLGQPQYDDTPGAYNFFSLGDTGWVEVQMGGAVITDGTPAADLRIAETSWGNPSCSAYPEYADISVSQDGVTWHNVGTVCHDGDIDLDSAAPGLHVHYVRVANSPLSNTDDYYDLDGVESIWGCNPDQVVDACPNYQLFYANNQPGSGSTIYRVQLQSNGTADLSSIVTLNTEVHIAFNESNGLLYAVNAGNGMLRAFDPNNGTQVGSAVNVHVGSQNIGQIPTGVFGPDGQLYLASQTGNKIYTVDPVSGAATLFHQGTPVSGGDLVFTLDGNLWLINRGQGKMYNVTTGDAPVSIGLPEVNGAALLTDGTILMANAGSTSFNVYNPGSGLEPTTYQTNITFGNGDLASGCSGAPQDVTPGSCYASSVINYTQGVQSNGNPLDADRIHAERALGAPQGNEADHEFVTLGYGGSITLAFDGPVINGPGADIHVVETSFGTPPCGPTYEKADIWVSQDGVNFYNAGTLCRDGDIDIDNAGAGLAYITQIKVVNNDAETNTNDGYDLDGVVALHNGCSWSEGGSTNPGGNAPLSITSYQTADQSLSTSDSQSGNTNPIQMNVYPNPFMNNLNVTTGRDFSNVTFEVYEFDKLVLTGKAERTGQGEYQIPNLNNRLPQSRSNNVLGQYILRLKADGKYLPSQMIVKGITKQ